MLKKNNDKQLCFINFQNNLNRFVFVNDKLIKSLSKNFKKIYILNLYNLRFFSKKIHFSMKKNEKLLPNNFEIKNFVSFNEFEEFAKQKKLIIIMNSLSKSIQDFKIYYYLKKVNAKLIMISNLGMFGSKIFIDIKPSQFFKGYKHLNEKGFYYIWRILTILNFFPKVELLFESNEENIKAFNTGISRKFENFFPIFKISLYRKIIRVNSKSFDIAYDQKKKKSSNQNKYILYIDSPLVHEDRTSREGPVDPLYIREYNKKLFNFLNKISKLYNKKVFITLHPASLRSFGKIKNFFLKNRNLNVSKKKTVDLVNDAYLVIFSCSSAVNHAIIFKKKILGINSKYFGNHLNNLHMKYIKNLNLPTINIDKENLKLYKKEILQKCKKSLRNYDNFIKKRLVYNKKPSYDEIPELIKKNFFMGDKIN